MNIRKEFFFSKSLLLYVFAVLACGCNTSRVNNLERENKKLKVRSAEQTKIIENLKQEISIKDTKIRKLSETDEAYFRKGTEQLQEGANKNSEELLAKSISTFTDLIVKFPHTKLKALAEQRILLASKKKKIIKVARDVWRKFDEAMKTQDYNKAAAQLEILKSYIPLSDYKNLQVKLDLEKNKPVETTINKLVSEFGVAKNKYDVKGMYSMRGRRVSFATTFTSIDRSRQALAGMSDGWGKGSRLEVFYAGTELEEHFTNNDPKCCDNRYKVTGVLNIYSNAGELYLKAEKIKVIRHE